ncbi:transposase [Aeromonas veronii]
MNNSRNKAEVILGVDTHLDTHVGVLLNAQGHQLGCLMVTTNISGYERLVTWANSFGCLKRAGVEGTGTYGAGLACVLRKHGVEVFEVNRPDRSKLHIPADHEHQFRFNVNTISGPM